MPKRVSIQLHITVAELERRYREAKCPVERSHYQIIWLLASGKTTSDVAEIAGYSRSWIYELVWGWNSLGVEAMGDRRRLHKGAEPLLTEEQQALLRGAIAAPPEGGGKWNGKKVAEVMSGLLGRPVDRQRGWEYLQRAKRGKSISSGKGYGSETLKPRYRRQGGAVSV